MKKKNENPQIPDNVKEVIEAKVINRKIYTTSLICVQNVLTASNSSSPSSNKGIQEDKANETTSNYTESHLLHRPQLVVLVLLHLIRVTLQ